MRKPVYLPLLLAGLLLCSGCSSIKEFNANLYDSLRSRNQQMQLPTDSPPPKEATLSYEDYAAERDKLRQPPPKTGTPLTGPAEPPAVPEPMK